jgi:hypothetical protein
MREKRISCEIKSVRTQFSKDDVESSDSSGYWIVDADVDGDDGV